MNRKDVMITIVLLISISSFLILTGAVRVFPYTLDAETGMKYYYDESRDFVHYYDPALDKKVGFFNMMKETLFFYDETKQAWFLLDDLKAETLIESLKGIEPKVSGEQMTSGKETYFYVKDIKFIYQLHTSSSMYVGYYEKKPSVIYYYDEKLKGWLKDDTK